MAKLTYSQDLRVLPDKEVAFQIMESGHLDDYNRMREDPGAFKRVMDFIKPRYVIRRDESGVLRVYDKQSSEAAKLSRSLSVPLERAEKLLLTIPSDRLEITTLLALANNTNYDCANRAYLQANGDYEAATRILERKKGFAPESERERSDESVENRVRMQERDDSVELIEEWTDTEIAAANIFQSTDEKDLNLGFEQN